MTNSDTKNMQSCLHLGGKNTAFCFTFSALADLPSRGNVAGQERVQEMCSFSGFPAFATPRHYLHLAGTFLEQLLIPCPAGSRHQGKVQLPVNTPHKKTIAVAGFSSAHFYFDFHIKKTQIPVSAELLQLSGGKCSSREREQPRGFLIPQPTWAELQHPSPGPGGTAGIPALSGTAGFPGAPAAAEGRTLERDQAHGWRAQPPGDSGKPWKPPAARKMGGSD